MRRLALAALFAAALTNLSVNATENVDLSERVRLQETMRRTIESRLVDGRYLYLKTASPDVVALIPGKAHPMVLRLDEFYVLCTDFRDEAGNPVNLDFYVADRNGEFVVFDTVVDNRAPLDALMKSGRAHVVN